MEHRAQLLSTATLDQPLIAMAAEQGIVIDCVPFIQVNYIEDIALLPVIAALCNSAITAVFTSANAIGALRRHLLIAKPHWSIYCIEGATREAVLRYFPATAIKGVAKDAAALASVIVSDKVSDVVFFCGDSRMDTLPAKLQQDAVAVREMIVYETVATPQVITRHYDGVLFFSPSGVDSFFGVNQIAATTVLFAIGITTGNAIKAVCSNEVIVGNNPSKERIVTQAISHFYKGATAALKD